MYEVVVDEVVMSNSKHPMAQAVGYTLNQWNELNLFAADGAVPIDNNISERQMKRIVLNRKNSLFVGNARGGRTAAILTNLPATPISQLDQWLPDVWKQRITSPT